jgi:hypothetical protein
MTTLERLERERAKKLQDWSDEELRQAVRNLAYTLDRRRSPKMNWGDQGWGTLSDIGRTPTKPKRGRPPRVPISNAALLKLRAEFKDLGFDSFKALLVSFLTWRRQGFGKRTTPKELAKDVASLQQRAAELAREPVRKFDDGSG